jgi:hypothetical protein
MPTQLQFRQQPCRPRREFHHHCEPRHVGHLPVVYHEDQWKLHVYLLA